MEYTALRMGSQSIIFKVFIYVSHALDLLHLAVETLSNYVIFLKLPDADYGYKPFAYRFRQLSKSNPAIT